MDVIVEQITLALFREDSKKLIVQHYEELSVDRAHPLDPHWELFETLERGGVLHVAGAYVAAGMIGYTMSIFVPRHLHYPFAYVQNDVLFVTKDSRRSTAGSRLMQLTREWAKEQGADQVLWHAKEGTELHRMLDGRPRFKLRDIIYSEQV